MTTKHYDPKNPKFDIPSIPFEDTQYIPKPDKPEETVTTDSHYLESYNELQSEEEFYELVERSYVPNYDMMDEDDELECNRRCLTTTAIAFSILTIMGIFIVSSAVYGLYKLFTL